MVVFDIDDASLATLGADFGPWPFKRDVYALAIEQLRDLGARAIALDLLLADSRPGDEALARAIARPGAAVVLAAAGLAHAMDSLPPPSASGEPNKASDFSTHPTTKPSANPTPAQAWPGLLMTARTVRPVGAVTPVGVMTTPLDDDDVLRRVPLWHLSGAVRLPRLALALRLVADNGQPIASWAVDGSGALHAAFAAQAARPPVHAFAELAAIALGRQDPAALRRAVQGRAVIIGSSALLADEVMTVHGQITGNDALAQPYSALAGAAAVRPPSAVLQWLLLALALAPAAWAVGRGRIHARHDTVAAAAALVLMAAVAGAALFLLRLPSAWAAPLAALATGFVASRWLHHRAQQRAQQRALAQQLAVAAETSRAKSAFLSNVSHEIRTPMNALLGVAELLVATPLSAQQRRHVQVFRDAGQSLLVLINELLDLSRIQAGRLTLDPAPFSTHQLLAHIEALMRPRAAAKAFGLRIEPPGLPADAVMGDRLRLEQCLINLLGNAIKFTARGRVRLQCTPGPAGWIEFEVSDTGIGIAPSKLDTIFVPFTQADGSSTRQFGGTGLGLSITRSTAQLMGGQRGRAQQPRTGQRVHAAPATAGCRTAERTAVAPGLDFTHTHSDTPADSHGRAGRPAAAPRRASLGAAGRGQRGQRLHRQGDAGGPGA